MMPSSEKKITLKSSDGEEFEIDLLVALHSGTIKHMIEDDCVGNLIPVPNINSKILSKVIEYCKKHVESTCNDTTIITVDEIKTFDADFVKVDHATLFDLILASNYLNIKGLLDLTSQTVGNMMIGKSPEEIRKIFNIIDNCKPEKEEEIRVENQMGH